jgi:hypothetical protein
MSRSTSAIAIIFATGQLPKISDRAEGQKVLRQFTSWLIGATILSLIIDIVLSLLSDISLPGHVMNTILIWGCAMIAGGSLL